MSSEHVRIQEDKHVQSVGHGVQAVLTPPSLAAPRSGELAIWLTVRKSANGTQFGCGTEVI